MKECYTSLVCDYNTLEAVLQEFEEDNLKLSDTIAAIDKELSTLTNDGAITVNTSTFCFKTKCGRTVYSIHKSLHLYYNLHLSRKTHDTYNSSFQGQRQFLTALAIETVLMILNSAHYK